jgi:hypothetical protein
MAFYKKIVKLNNSYKKKSSKEKRSFMLKTVKTNNRQCKCDTILLNVIKFVSDLRQVGGFLPVLRIPPLIKLAAMI